MANIPCWGRISEAREARPAFRRRWASTRYVQDMWELLAKLQGELSREAGENAHRVRVVVNNTGKRPLDPEIFREAARRKVLEQRDGLVDEDD